MAERVRLGDLLIDKGFITKEQFQTAMEYKKGKGAEAMAAHQKGGRDHREGAFGAASP